MRMIVLVVDLPTRLVAQRFSASITGPRADPFAQDNLEPLHGWFWNVSVIGPVSSNGHDLGLVNARPLSPCACFSLLIGVSLLAVSVARREFRREYRDYTQTIHQCVCQSSFRRCAI